MNKNYFSKGITDLLILTLLSDHDCYMYELVKSMSDYSKGKLSIAQNTIYTAAYKLEQDGMISEYSKVVGRKRTRIYYHLEPEGQNLLNTLIEKYRNTVEGVDAVLSTFGN